MGEAADYVIIGGSNGGNLGQVIVQKGRKVIDVTEKGIRITAEAVDKLEKKLCGNGKDASLEDMAMEDVMVIILWVMDNSLYFVEDEDGARSLSKRGEDRKYHIEGQQSLPVLTAWMPPPRMSGL